MYPFLGGVTWELRVYSDLDRRGISLWTKRQMQDIRFCLEGQRAESLSMKELQCRPQQYMPVSESLRRQSHPYRFMYMSIRMTEARSWCMTIRYIICSMMSRTRR